MLPNRLSVLLERARRYYAAFAGRPFVGSNRAAAYDLFVLGYEARAAAADQNPVFAADLLRAFGTGPAEPAAPQMPTVPRGVYWEVDAPGRGDVRVSLDIAGLVTAAVQRPGADAAAPVVVVSTAGRNVLVFAAAADGLYAVRLRVGGAIIATVYIPVMRHEWRRLREHNRRHSFAFLPVRPVVSEAFTTHLSLLALAEAAARTGRADLFAIMVAHLAAQPSAPAPSALFPHES